jgi:8-oxo-dGTP pyrophosphatase MutT (NUDIX family)
MAVHRPARCIECAQAAAKPSPRATPTELQPYLARELRPAEAAGYKAAGVLPMRRAPDGTLEVLLALERRQDWAIRGRNKSAAKAKAASGRVEGTFLHPIGGSREADDDSAVATAAREFDEDIGYALSAEAEGSNSAPLTQASIDMLKGARGRHVLWQPRGKYALWVYLLPAEQADLAEKFAAWKASKKASLATKTAKEQSTIDVRWVPVSRDGTVQFDQHTKPDTDDAEATGRHLATSFCMELLQRNALRQHLAHTARRLLRLQLSVGSASPTKSSGRASTPSPLAQSPMLTVAAEALLSKRLAAATPSPTQKKQRKGKKRLAGDVPSQTDEKRPNDAPTDAPADVEISAADTTAAVTDADDAAARKQAKKRAKKHRKKLTKRKSEEAQNKNDAEEKVSNIPSEDQSSSLKRKQPEANVEESKIEDEDSGTTKATEPHGSNDAAKRPKTAIVESQGDSKADSAAAGSRSSQGEEPTATTVEQKEAQCNQQDQQDQQDQQLFVEDRTGSHADADCATGDANGNSSGADVEAPKKLNRAERKQQRKLAHAARLKAKAAAADADAASLLLVSSETDVVDTAAAPGGAPLASVAETAGSGPTTAEPAPLPSPRTLGKFRFTGTGLQIG